MDETQRRKLSAKEFIEKNRALGLGIIGLFLSLFAIYFAFVFFYGNEAQNAEDQIAGTQEEEGFFDSLLPVFTSTENKEDLDSDFLGNFGTTNNFTLNPEGEDTEANDNSRLIKIEDKPVLAYTVFDKPVSIKNYIKNKPKICTEKIETVLTKESNSPAVKILQTTLRSIDEFNNTPDSGVLDEQTREKLYLFQSKYADILYKAKADKTPTRLIDKETAHFLNLLCNFENEDATDFVQVPTLRYVTKENREIFDYNTESKDKAQVDAKVATGTEEAIFNKKGDLVMYRKEINGTIDTIFYNIRTKSVAHLENNITTLDFNDKNILFYGIPGTSGMTIKSYDYLTNSTKRIATLPLNEWNIQVINANEIGISSKPTAYADGIFMSLNLQTNKLRQLAGPLLGLSVQKTTIPDFSILSIGGQGTVKTLLLNNNTRNVGDFGINTFAEKCAQTIFADGIFCAVPKNLVQGTIYPDDWYKRKLITQDIIMYKTISGTSTRVVSYLEGRPLSLINLSVNRNGIFFMDESGYDLYSLLLQ